MDSAGAALKGFAHEFAEDVSLPQNIQIQVPGNFSSFLGELAFSMQHATFCYWRKAGDQSWSKVSSSLADDGSSEMLELFVSGPLGYKNWAEDYFEVMVPLELVTLLFSHEPLADSLILALNPKADLDFTYAQAKEIGYPRTSA